MDFKNIPENFFRFPYDSPGIWLIIGALALGVILLIIHGWQEEHSRARKILCFYAALITETIVLIIGLPLSMLQPTLFTLLFGVPAVLTFLIIVNAAKWENHFHRHQCTITEREQK